jgi:hypothetical protein
VTSEIVDVVHTFSASLPAIFGLPARPWNGRSLTDQECQAARVAFSAELHMSGSLWFAAQAAHEALSEVAW